MKQDFSLKFILKFLKGSKFYFFLSIIFLLLVTFISLLIPYVISFTIDTLILGKKDRIPVFLSYIINFFITDNNIKNYYLVAALLLAIGFLSSIFSFLSRYLNSLGTETMTENIRNTTFHHLTKLPFKWFKENKSGDIIQRVTSDIETIKTFLSSHFTEFFRLFMLISISIYFMFNISIKLSLLAIVFFPINILHSIYSHKRISEMFRRVDDEEGQLSAVIQENLTGIRVVRAFGKELFEKNRFEKQNKIFCDILSKFNITFSFSQAIGIFITGLQMILITVAGSYLTVHGELLVGEYVAFFAYNSMLIWPIRSFGRIISNFSKTKISVSRIEYILDSPIEVDYGAHLTPTLDGDISFENVSFSYEDGQEVLKNISFTIKGGSKVGILGATGSGKSTITYLITRLYSLPKGSGKISIGGIDINDVELSYLRNNIALVLQEPYLFSKTIGENIALSSDEVTTDNLSSVAEMASLIETIKEFKDGFDTKVGERGVTLSGGQKQRAAIARMLLKKSPIIIFDDSLSAVDTETESKIKAALFENDFIHTSIIISHRVTTLMETDFILVLDDGKIAEMGNHDELLSKDGLYKKIYDIQFAR